MGGRGSSSASKRAKSSTTAWQDMVADTGAAAPPVSDYNSLITSQIGTAPKRGTVDVERSAGLITSQIGTAPKRPQTT